MTYIRHTQNNPLLYVIKRQIQVGIHSSTRTVYQYLHPEGRWKEERMDALTFRPDIVEEWLQKVRAKNHDIGRCLCTMKEPA